MTHAEGITPPQEPFSQAFEDYQRIARAIHFLRNTSSHPPSLAETAAAAGLSEAHFQKLFSRWAGISPKRFLQYLTLQNAKSLLRQHNTSVLDSSLDLGLSGPSRLHDLFITLEAVTPGEFRQLGRQLTLHYGLHPSPLGTCFIASSHRGITHLQFLDSPSADAPLAKLRHTWPQATLVENPTLTLDLLKQIFPLSPDNRQPLSLLVKGTNFQIQVWQALLRIPYGECRTYSDIATEVGHPSATRAVGTAIGANPISWLIPCHRVLRRDGSLGGYRWGLERKIACLAIESARS